VDGIDKELNGEPLEGKLSKEQQEAYLK